MSYRTFENEVIVRIIDKDEVKGYLIADGMDHNSMGIWFYRGKKISAFIPRRSDSVVEIVEGEGIEE